MFPVDFDYARAESLEHALDLLAEAEADELEAKLLAGGQSLLPMMKLRLAAPQLVIDLGAIPALSGITVTPSGASGPSGDGTPTATIGALTTYRALQRDPALTTAVPALADALDVLADPQVRARGTIGGAVAHGDPAADLPAVLLALGATVEIAGRDGTRTIALDDFLQGLYATDLAPGEILTAVVIPASAPGSAYEKFAQPASHLPLAGVCAIVELRDNRIASAKVAVTGVSVRPYRALHAERTLVNSAPAPETLAAAAAQASKDAAGDDIHALADQHASAPFRRHLAQVLARRALTRAVARAGSR